MKYWINVHHPQSENESRQTQLRVCVQEKNHPDKRKIPEGSIALIYETNALIVRLQERILNGLYVDYRK